MIATTGASPQVNVVVETNMHNDTENGWRPVITFTQVTAGDQFELKNGKGLLRYVRWKVTLGGSTTDVVFTLEGMARSWS